MIRRLQFYSMNRVDIGIGASKDVVVIYKHDFTKSVENEVMFAGHPNPKAVSFELLDKDVLRVINNSVNVVSLWPGRCFLVLTTGHPVYEAWSGVTKPTISLRSATFKARVTDISIDIDALDLSDSIKAKLREAGYARMSDLEGCTSAELTRIRGIGTATAKRILGSVSSVDGKK